MDKKLKSKVYLALVMLLILLLIISGGTYAWFTANRNVNTNRISGKTATESVTLYLSAESGAKFSKKNECAIVQVNSAATDREYLLPVSTDDLKSFVDGNGMGGYTLIEQEDNYFHGRVYMMAEAGETADPDAKLDIYLNNTDTMMKADAGSLLMNAARLGLSITDQEPVILSLSDKQNDKNQQVSNTYLDGKLIADGMVLHSSTNGAIKAVTDPAIFFKSLDVTASGSKPIATIELGKEYTVDIYFYLEGCDPDCSDSIEHDGGLMNLQLMGILSE